MLGAASARPQLHALRNIADDRAKFPLRRLYGRCHRQAQHQHLCARRLHAFDDVACGQIGPEIGDAQAGAGREHRGAKRADLMTVARGRRKEQPGRHVPAGVQAEERAEDVPYGRGHQVLLGDAGASPMPVVADLHEHRHQHVPEKVEGTEDGRQTGDLLIDARCVVRVQGGLERCRVERRPLASDATAGTATAPAAAQRSRS